ncbi:trypsin-like serine peptidase [Nonomuraea fastidiosa]|uniref:trypsin-like serine peptidase n=1 Tax=Nonomuraea fastidiosa TaxID=46173 RepID=UPI00366B5529
MKRILLPAGGAVLATGLLAAGLSTTAQADSKVANADLAKNVAAAQEIVEFWTKSNNAALKKAVAFSPDSLEVKKTVSGGGYTADTKPGMTAPIGGEKKASVKVQNVNLPKTIGKVFFEGHDGKLYWCSGTSIQSKYRNLVATAGHCVYDVVSNKEVVSRWVFVPGYYQGKTPWGLYVGKQAFTHYDFEVYEDFDRDYAFVTVYDALKGSVKEPKKVYWDEFKKYRGEKFVKEVPVSREEARKRLDPHNKDVYYLKGAVPDEKVGPDYPGAELTKREVTAQEYFRAKTGQGQGRKYGEPEVEQVTYNEAIEYLKGQGWDPKNNKPAVPNEKFPGTVKLDQRGNSTITHYFVQHWVKKGTERGWVRKDFYIVVSGLKSGGRLGDNVGGQGFAWNQPGQERPDLRLPAGPAPGRQQAVHRRHAEVVLRQDLAQEADHRIPQGRGAAVLQVRRDGGLRRWSVAVQLQQRQASRLRQRCHQPLRRPRQERPLRHDHLALLRR